MTRSIRQLCVTWFFFRCSPSFQKAKKKLIKQSDYDFLVDNFIFLDIHILTSEQVES